MPDIKVSTLSPCFRMKKYLKEFLYFLPEQTIFNDLEIVIDHNEPDEDEVGWIINFQKKYPDRIRHNVVDIVDPYGISINRCLDMSRGKYIAFWNVDDFRTKNSLERQLIGLQSQSAQIAYGNYTKIKQYGNKSGQYIDVSKIDHNRFLSEYHFGPFFMFEKNIINSIGMFDEQFKCAADFDFGVRAARSFKSAYIDNDLGYYLDAADGLSTKPNSVQQIERTVIELRYGAFDKIDFQFIPMTSEYSIPYIFFNKNFHHVRNFFPEYEKYKRENFDKKYGLAINNFEKKRKREKRRNLRSNLKSLFSFKI